LAVGHGSDGHCAGVSAVPSPKAEIASGTSRCIIPAPSLSDGADLFRWGRQTAINERAKSLARMVMFICLSLRTKNYEEFVAGFSNPAREPDASERQGGQLRFQMRFSPTCWYDAVAEYPRTGGTPHFFMDGGGDDWGVFISGNAKAKHGVTVNLNVPSGSAAGSDARAMVRALQAMRGWSKFSDLERALGMVD
jgi:hypothetical protein